MFRSLRGVTARFVVVFAVLVPSLFAVAAVAAQGLHQVGGAVDFLYGNTVLTTQAANDLTVGLDDAHELALGALASDDPARRRALSDRLVEVTAPQVEVDLARLDGHLDPAEGQERAQLVEITAGWRRFVAVVAGGQLQAGDAHLRSQTADQVSVVLDPVAQLGHQIADQEADQARAADRLAVDRRHRSLEMMAIALGVALALSVAAVMWLIRSVLPRTLAYSRFAARVAEGDDRPMPEPTGGDEISQLGRALQEMANRGRARRAYEHTQFEFAEALQLTGGEEEAHSLLKHHLERAIAGSQITVLNRNNSADRLEAVTPVADSTPLGHGLEGAKPRSCLAVRQARVHRQDTSKMPLVACEVCTGCSSLSTCTPLLVGGEVIGSVLACHDTALDNRDAARIHQSVVQAAPVLANLRNLAIAELRAATDALTGLANKRAVGDSLKRMVAQANRSGRSLAMLMLDLDHFKEINDSFGHGRGDEVLAAVGAALHATVRDSDFAGRYGGEEFVVLLPDVTVAGAVAVAEKIRATVARIVVADLDRPVTVSIGIGMVPEHGGDPATLERAADRALYAAKRNGRDRAEIAGNPTQARPAPARHGDKTTAKGPAVPSTVSPA